MVIAAPATPIAVLRREWAQLITDPRADATVMRWARETPDLDLLAGGLRGVLPRYGDYAATNRVLAALLDRAAAPDYDGRLATRVIIQLMLPRTAAVAHRLPQTCGGTADRQQLALTSLMDTIRAFPRDGSVDRVCGYLATWTYWRAMRQAARERRRELLSGLQSAQGQFADDLSTATGDDFTLHALEQIAVDPTANASEQLVRLLAWALESGALDQDAASLLAQRCSFDGHYTGGGASSTAVLARQLGVSEATARQRISRAQRRLADAVSDALAAA